MLNFSNNQMISFSLLATNIKRNIIWLTGYQMSSLLPQVTHLLIVYCIMLTRVYDKHSSKTFLLDAVTVLNYFEHEHL